MKRSEYKYGQPVKFAHPNGSIGRVIARHGDDSWTVRWSYGLDKKGEPIHSTSIVLPKEVVPATLEEYRMIHENPCGW